VQGINLCHLHLHHMVMGVVVLEYTLYGSPILLIPKTYSSTCGSQTRLVTRTSKPGCHLQQKPQFCSHTHTHKAHTYTRTHAHTHTQQQHIYTHPCACQVVICSEGSIAQVGYLQPTRYHVESKHAGGQCAFSFLKFTHLIHAALLEHLSMVSVL